MGSTMKNKFTGLACRWWDRVNGNTYCSVKIINNRTGKAIAAPFQYGGGDFYRQAALEAMLKAHWLPKQYGEKGQAERELWYYERDNNYPIQWIVKDGTKAECIANGTLDKESQPEPRGHLTESMKLLRRQAREQKRPWGSRPRLSR